MNAPLDNIPPVREMTNKQLSKLALKAAAGDTKVAARLLRYMSAPKIPRGKPQHECKGRVRFPRLKDKDVWHNGFHPISPEHLIGSLETAKQEISYSNYDCANLDRLREILYRYCEEHNVPLGRPFNDGD